MGTDLANIKTLSADQIMLAIGQNVAQKPTLPQLTINRQADDADGNQLPVGVYSLYDSETRSNVYGKPVFFRPFLNLFQYRKYDAATNAYTNRSILFRNWNEDIIDEQGGKRCGKISGKAALGLSESAKERNRQISCVRYLYGTTNISGRDVKGTARTLSGIPCLWRTRGVAFKPIGDAIEGLTRENKFMFNHVFELSTKREQTGSNVYYSPVLKLTDKIIELSDEDALLFKQFQDLIQAQNDEIYTKWQTVQKKKLNETEKELVNNLTNRPLDADFEEVKVVVPFDDDISHVGTDEVLTPMNAG